MSNISIYRVDNAEWATWGYPSDHQCVVCGKVGNNQSEPRFGYTVCQDHARVSPIDISVYIAKQS